MKFSCFSNFVFYLIHTMKAFLIPVFIFLFVSQSFAQSGYDVIAAEICDSISARCMDKDSATAMQMQQAYTLSAMLHHPEICDSLKKSIRMEIPGLDETSVMGIFSSRLAKNLIFNCESFILITQYKTFASVPGKESLRLISSEMCGILENSDKTTLEDYQQLMNENLFPIVLRYQREIAADYSGGYESPEFIDDIAMYLLKHCLVLLKASLLNEYK